MIQIGIASDTPMRLAGLVSIFDEDILIGLVPAVCTVAELVTGSSLPYLILDIQESHSSATLIHAILRASPGIRVMIVGPQSNDDCAMEAIWAGARAYLDLTCEIDTVRQALEVIVAGGIWGPHRLLSKLVDQLLKINDSTLNTASPLLTSREKEVAELIVAARPNLEIARELGIGAQTVTAHVGRIMRKTGTMNRIELASYMRKNQGFTSDTGSYTMQSTMLALK